MARYPAPSPPYLGPAARTGGSGNKPIKRVVIHGTTGANSCREGYARLIARYFRTTTRPASAHYAVDPGEVVQIVWDSIIAYHAPPNRNSLGIEMCDPVAGPLSRWRDRPHRQMLDRTAKLTAQLCLAYGLPPKFRGRLALLAGRRGVTTHALVGEAWGQTSHWDPGKWPRRRFMRLVQEYHAELQGKTVKRNTRVRRARGILDDALDLLAAVPDTRTRVRRITRDLRDAADRLPEQ